MDTPTGSPIPRLRRARLAAAAAAAALAIAAVAGPALAADAAVEIANFAFAPNSVTVNVGDTVTWTNADSAPHTATADDGSFDTGQLAQGDSGDATFDTAGTFAYHCAIHPNMIGTVVVEAAGGGESPAVTTPPTDTTVPASEVSGGVVGALVALGAAIAAAFVSALAFGRRDRQPG